MDITTRNVQRVFNEHPEYAEVISMDALTNGQVSKYTTGSYGIANAYIPLPTGENLIINPKNALYALMLIEALEVQELGHNYFRNEQRCFDTLIWLLMPQDDLAQEIADPFYRRVFRNTGVRDDVRNAINSKAFDQIFKYNLTSHFKCVANFGEKYSEGQIQAAAEEIYQNIREDYTDSCGGEFKMTNTMRCVIAEKAAKTLEENYGWEFDYREYDDIDYDVEVIEAIRAAFPQAATTVAKMGEIAINSRSEAIAKYTLTSETLNPIAETSTYRDAQCRGIANVQEVIGYDEEEKAAFIRRNTGKETEEVLAFEYLRMRVNDYVIDTNEMRGVEMTATHFQDTVDSVTNYIWTKQMMLKE